jgi:hypothetical protein
LVGRGDMDRARATLDAFLDGRGEPRE